MPTIIRVGCKVSGAVGPFLEPTPGQTRRKRVRFDGVVICSAPGQKWTVYWTNISQACDHHPNTLRFVSAGTEESLRRYNIDDILTIRFINSIDEYLASWQQPAPAPQPSRRNQNQNCVFL